MASVTLDEMWLHNASDLADFVTLEVSELVEVPGSETEVRRYANGTLRLIQVGGIRHSYSVFCRLPNRAAVDQVRQWAGQLLLLRDPLGRKLFGRYQEAKFREVPMYDVGFVFEAELTFDEVTHSEEV